MDEITPEHIRQIRRKLKLSQTAFAEIVGVAFTTINRWENGHTKPHRVACRRMFELEKTIIEDDNT
jgi:putative transcriptional regulator